MKTVRVLIVDDSLLFREMLAREISKDPRILVIGKASDPYEARDKILELRPDVLTLDVEMPKMNGIEFLRRLLPQYLIPVVVSSSRADAAFDAMEAGAVDFVAKPHSSGADAHYFKEVAEKVIIASEVKNLAKHQRMAQNETAWAAQGNRMLNPAAIRPIPGSSSPGYNENRSICIQVYSGCS